MTVVEQPQAGSSIRSFHVDVPAEALTELRHQLAATRWPSRELVADRSQGVQLATVQELARFWEQDYDWRRCEARLNALPQFKTEIDGVDVHFIHVRSPHPDALPLVITHGWPGSVIELLEAIGPLTDPPAYDGRPEDAFDLVLPSLPGYGFSTEPAEVGWDAGRIARAWAELMRRLGYTRYVAQGGDQGAGVTDAMGRQAPAGLVGIHLNFLRTAIAGGPQPQGHEQEHAAAEAVATFRKSGFGYFLEQTTRPQTIGYALLGSPVALGAWMIDHDTDSYYKISARLSRISRPATSPRTTSSTTSRCTGSRAQGPQQPGRTGKADEPLPFQLTRLPLRCRSRLASPHSRTRSSGRRGAGSRRPTPTSLTSTKSTKVATSPPGKSPSCSLQRSGPHLGHYAQPNSPEPVGSYRPSTAPSISVQPMLGAP